MGLIGNPSRTTPQTLTISGTATGESTDTVVYGEGYKNFGIVQVTSGSTKNMVFTVQGSIGVTNIWSNLIAITTGSTSGVLINSTAELIVDRVRLRSTANLTTSTAHVLTVTLLPEIGR